LLAFFAGIGCHGQTSQLGGMAVNISTGALEGGKVVRIVKRLRAAAGYHELGMNQHAMASLDALQPLGDIGPFRLVEEILRGEFLKAEKDYGGAAVALEAAARMLPPPENQALWLALSACYREAGDDPRADNSLACARGATPNAQPNPPKSAC
jgi:hypothetical protein